VPEIIRRQRNSALQPKRKVIRVGDCNLPVELSPQDKDLCKETWYQHTQGYLYRMQRKLKGGKLTVTAIWLHREVAKRICSERGVAMPRRVYFLNGKRLDCRRENIRI